MRPGLLVPVVVALAFAPAAVPACGQEGDAELPEIPTELPADLPTRLPSDLPTRLPTGVPSISLPDLPSIPLPDLDGEDADGGEDGEGGVAAPPVTVTATATQTATETATTTATATATATATQTVTPTASPSSEPASSPGTEPAVGEGGVPWWGWALLALAAIAVVAVIVALLGRRRVGPADRDRAADADAQLAWVRTQVDDALLRWRGGRIAAPPDAPGDTVEIDSEPASRWALVDDRLGVAIGHTAALAADAGSADLRRAADTLHGAVEAYRQSIDTAAAAHATGDPVRIAAAARALAVDGDLVDRARRRLRDAAGLTSGRRA